jgi:hypothetical protein
MVTLPTNCLLCTAPLICNITRLYCQFCKSKFYEPLSAFEIFINSKREIDEYLVEFEEKWSINSSMYETITILQPNRQSIGKYIEYKHDLKYFAEKHNALRLLA